MRKDLKDLGIEVKMPTGIALPITVEVDCLLYVHFCLMIRLNVSSLLWLAVRRIS
jgi:hypothetical protein